jgi:hypothetical protein
MANEPEKIAGGVFIDTKTGDVVGEKPEEGMQIVPEGGVLDSVAQGILDAEGKAVPGSDAEAKDDADKTVTTKSVKGK